MKIPTIFEKLPAMFSSALLTGVVLEIILPKTEYINDTKIRRGHFVFGGICIATWLAYRRVDQQ